MAQPLLVYAGGFHPQDCVDNLGEFLVSTMEAFKREMFQEFKSHSNQMQELTKSVEFLSANIDTANQTLKKVQLDYADIMKQNQKLTEANLKLGETVNELKSKVRELEQYSRRTNLEISGIPETRNEDTMKILGDIGTAIGVELHDTQVMAAHRVPSYKQGRAPPMVVQFQTKMQRDVWITNYKKNKDLSARRVNNVFPDTRVYINEHLSPDNKIFLAQLKERSKQCNVKYVWFKDDKFYLRRDDGEKYFKITSLDEVEKYR
ncbi:uncharacterized protein LOC124361154 [Homalodisca vitripennis]|uniref:uncharacterized protein LOC124361154 n=1 Tax=Homalodisca vitripennis TaxID=197043 RepID=UPI001EEAE6AB|nr:uncharacterized protein LOC124361154 [Homalodisca vitripennis]